MGSDANVTERLIKVDATVCCAVFQASVAARISSGCGCNSSTRETAVSAILRVMSLDQEPHFQTYHRVLNRAVWSSRKASAILLKQLVGRFAARGVIVMGIDDTIERRYCAKTEKARLNFFLRYESCFSESSQIPQTFFLL
jgi:hypothetical protein